MHIFFSLFSLFIFGCAEFHCCVGFPWLWCSGFPLWWFPCLRPWVLGHESSSWGLGAQLPRACGILVPWPGIDQFPDRRLLHCKVDSYTLDHQGSSSPVFLLYGTWSNFGSLGKTLGNLRCHRHKLLLPSEWKQTFSVPWPLRPLWMSDVWISLRETPVVYG